mmetsp:Transcript_29954/g.95592  ORF Transcript_29954/g.95592 Transcript_29954/m.95592 type:complete len:476 (-) Transcript_29954:202-1629(-)
MHDDGPSMPEVGVRPVAHEEVRQAWRRDAQVRGGAARPLPGVADVHAGALDAHGEEEVRGPETCGVDDDVCWVRLPVATNQRVLSDAVDLVRHKGHVVALEGLDPLVVDEHAGAVGRVVRQDLAEEFLVAAALLPDVARQAPAPLGAELGAREQRLEVAVRHPPELAEAVVLVVERHPAQAPPHVLLDLLVVPRVRLEPRGNLLEDRDVRSLRGRRPQELHGAGACAHDRDALALQGQALQPPPLGRVHRRPGPEALAARDRRHAGARELAAGADDGVGLQRGLHAAGAADRHAPRGRGVLEGRGQDLGAEADEGQHVVGLRHATHVGRDLLALREVPAPLGVGREGEAVVVARHVAARLRVAVVVPSAAAILSALADHETHAHLAELRSCADARGPGADDEDPQAARAAWLGQGRRALARHGAAAARGVDLADEERQQALRGLVIEGVAADKGGALGAKVAHDGLRDGCRQWRR